MKDVRQGLSTMFLSAHKNIYTLQHDHQLYFQVPMMNFMQASEEEGVQSVLCLMVSSVWGRAKNMKNLLYNILMAS
jgi:hypothetical protein